MHNLLRHCYEAKGQAWRGLRVPNCHEQSLLDKIAQFSTLDPVEACSLTARGKVSLESVSMNLHDFRSVPEHKSWLPRDSCEAVKLRMAR